MNQIETFLTLGYYSDDDFDEVKSLLQSNGLFFEEMESREIYEEKIKADPQSIVVVKTEEEVVGVVFITDDPWCSYIRHLCVKEGYRHNGVATMLGKKVVDELRSRGRKMVWVSIDEGNEASLSLVEKYGFEYYEHDGKPAPVFVASLKLN